MPTWNQIVRQIESLPSGVSLDSVRHDYLSVLARHTGRPVIGYYSGWLSKRLPDGRLHPEVALTDLDMNGMMAVVYGLDRTRGLDIVLHTPGGEIEAARAIVEYLHKMFGHDLRVIVPHMAMSAGTMLACACREIVLGKHSCLGPTDPQIRGWPAMGVLAEVDRAIREISADPRKTILWQQVFSKYPPAFILDCERAVEGAKAMVAGWLQRNMLREANSPKVEAERIVAALMDYEGTSAHGHHFLIDKCIDIGLNVYPLESDQHLQEAVLSVHHSYMATFHQTRAIKLIENSAGASWSVQD